MQTISSAWAFCMEICIKFTPKRTTKSVILSAAHMTLWRESNVRYRAIISGRSREIAWTMRICGNFPAPSSLRCVGKAGETERQFSALLAHFLEASAIGHIAFLVREPADPPEKIVGCIGLAKVLEMMRAQEIYENIVYLIRADDKENDDGKFGHV